MMWELGWDVRHRDCWQRGRISKKREAAVD